MMIRPFWLIPTLLSFSRPRRSIAWSTLSRAAATAFRGGQHASTPPPSSSSPFAVSSRSPYSSLRASLAAKQDSSVQPLPVDSADPADADLTKSLSLGPLPVESFGGLSYWNTYSNAKQHQSFRVVFVLGGPGAGKGTQSAFLQEHYPVAHFSVGELLRNVDETSPHADVIQQALVAGQIVPVEISLSLLRQAMQEATETAGRECICLVDGFPRNADNLSGWCRFMTNGDETSNAADLWGVLVYTCPEKVLEERILERAKLSGRSDDNLESVRKRFQTFQDQTQPIIDELSSISQRLEEEQRTPDESSSSKSAVWKVWEIAGDQSLPDVTQNTQQMFNQLIRNDILTANQRLLQAIAAGDVETYQELCDASWFADHDAATVMQKQEGDPATSSTDVGDISDARMEFVSGKNVIVSYQRQMEGHSIVESRVWVHQGTAGWQNVHFSRTPSP